MPTAQPGSARPSTVIARTPQGEAMAISTTRSRIDRVEHHSTASSVIVPALTDAHGHVGLGLSLVLVDLRSCRSPTDCAERVRAILSKIPPGTWVRGRGWDQNLSPTSSFRRGRRLTPSPRTRPSSCAGWTDTLAGPTPRRCVAPTSRVTRRTHPGDAFSATPAASQRASSSTTPRSWSSVPSALLRPRGRARHPPGPGPPRLAGLTSVHEMGIALRDCGHLPASRELRPAEDSRVRPLVR